MSDLQERLEAVGLLQYYDAFVAEGFDTWDTLLDVTESDLNALNVKLGHRRKLQRAIAESRGVPSDRALPILVQSDPSAAGSYKSDDSGAEGRASKKGDTSTSAPRDGPAKRKYRRHPKPDENAPERPPSAYVIFSNQIREELKGQDLSFTEIAKYVGERWQVLSSKSREACERQATAAKERYYAELAEYKKTAEFAEYQEYLKEFKARHASTGAGKRSKMEMDLSLSTHGSSHDNLDKALHRRGVGAGALETSAHARRRSGSSPLQSGMLRSASNSNLSKPTSPMAFSQSGYNSPRITTEHQSPIAASPRSSLAAHKERSHDSFAHPGPAISAGLDSRERVGEGSGSGHFPPYLSRQSTSSTPSSTGYTSQYPSTRDASTPRRPRRESSNLPALTHEDTTLSSDSVTGNPPYQGPLLPPMDASKSQRTLPQPIPSVNYAPPALEIRQPQLPPPASTGKQDESRSNSSLAALLRAGELARDADMQSRDKEPPN